MKISLLPLLLPLLLPALLPGASSATAAPAERIPDARLAFAPLAARVGVLSAKPVSTVLRSWSEYFEVVGAPPPSDIDFRHEWVAYYGAGLQHVGGAVATIESIELVEEGRELRIATRLSLPALARGAAAGRDIPYAMVKFRRPPSIPGRFEFVGLRGMRLATR